ncbi:hypothetical protein JCM21900_005833 [Sporobolomyces salmonicolor]
MVGFLLLWLVQALLACIPVYRLKTFFSIKAYISMIAFFAWFVWSLVVPKGKGQIIAGPMDSSKFPERLAFFLIALLPLLLAFREPHHPPRIDPCVDLVLGDQPVGHRDTYMAESPRTPTVFWTITSFFWYLLFNKLFPPTSPLIEEAVYETDMLETDCEQATGSAEGWQKETDKEPTAEIVSVV